MAKETRTRNWTTVVYPESAPLNWRDILDDQHLEWVESPLHEFDTDPTGVCKKPHWHILIMFGGVKSYDQVLEVIKDLNCAAPQRCHNAKSLVRYMAHLDNPDKYQYSVTDIRSHGGVDVNDLLKPSSAERYTMIRDIIQFCDDNQIYHFSDLMYIAIDEHFDDWFPILCDSSAYIVNTHLKSVREKRRDAKYED